MLKLTSLALGLLTVIAIAPASQAATINPLSFDRSVNDLHPQVIARTDDRHKQYRHREVNRHQSRERSVSRHRKEYSHHDR